MKQFIKFTLATITGVIISSVLLFFILLGIIAALVGSASEESTQHLENNSVLELKLNTVINERKSNNPFEQINFNTFEANQNSGLDEILTAIKEAEINDHIKGIYLNVSISPNDYATLQSIRNALIEFKKSKKFIVAYGEMMEEHSYYIASVADEIYLNPAGELLLDGFSSSTAYLKGMFDKLGLEPQLIRHGKYKAAGEPLIANEMSTENRQQIEGFLGSMYRNFVFDIAKARQTDTNTIHQIINELKVQSPQDAKSLKLITDIYFEDQVHEVLCGKVKVDDVKDIHFVSSGKVAAVHKKEPFSTKEKIAVIYCTGDIVSGKSSSQTMGSETIVESLRKAKNDSSVKAVVLRINSPGGSAMASDVMWREVMLTKKAKPVVVSMGELAASGGYYIAAPADVIVAQPNTITGSIGVFALLLNAQKLLKEKLGINMETVKFGKYADMGTADRPLSNEEKAILQKYVDRIYDDFIQKVAQGRKLSVEQVHAIAQGRVWSGSDAKKIGLVDELGGLDRALNIAAKKAKIGNYRLLELPEQKEPFEQLMESLSTEARLYFTKQQFGEYQEWYNQVKKATQYEGIQMRMPMKIDIH